jgi:hypothetical protein
MTIYFLEIPNMQLLYTIEQIQENRLDNKNVFKTLANQMY